MVPAMGLDGVLSQEGGEFVGELILPGGGGCVRIPGKPADVLPQSRDLECNGARIGFVGEHQIQHRAER